MSANIPLDIQEEIIKQVLPVKSLIRFRTVSKQWKSLIDSSEFITHHSLNHTQPHHLLVTYIEKIGSEIGYVSIVDDDSFPYHRFSPTVSPTVKLVRSVLMVGCSHGLVCLHGFSRDPVNSQKLIVVWNPSIRKSVGIVLSYGIHDVFGFGVCPKTSDPKIVKLPRSIGYEAKAEVFTLRSGSGAWRSVSMNLAHKLSVFPHTPVVIDGVMHWAAYDYDDYTYHYHRRLVSFDLTSEEFGEVDLPEGLTGRRNLGISKLKQSLVVLDYYYHTGDITKPVCDVWMMLKNGVRKSSFTKMFTVKVSPNGIIGFRQNGLPIILKQTNGLDKVLKVYEPGSELMHGIGIYGRLFDMASYTESLFLLNHSDSIIQW